MSRHRADRTLIWAVCGLGLSAAALATGIGGACAATPYAAYSDRLTMAPNEGILAEAGGHEGGKPASAAGATREQDQQN